MTIIRLFRKVMVLHSSFIFFQSLAMLRKQEKTGEVDQVLLSALMYVLGRLLTNNKNYSLETRWYIYDLCSGDRAAVFV